MWYIYNTDCWAVRSVAQSCLTLCDPVGCSPPGSSVHGILQAGTLEWAAMPPSRDLPSPGAESRSPTLRADSSLSEPPGKPLLLSHEREQNWVVCRDMDCHTEWSESKEKRKCPVLTHIVWCLKNWYRWSCLQNRNRDTDAENKHMDPEGGRGGEGWIRSLGSMCVHRNGWSGWLMRTYCIAQGTLRRALWWPRQEGNPEKRTCVYNKK